MLLLSDGDLAGAVKLLEAALAGSGGDQALRAVVARRLGGLYWWQGRGPEATALLRQAVDLAQALGDARAEFDALTMGSPRPPGRRRASGRPSRPA